MGLLSDIEPVDAVLERPHGLLEAPRFSPDGELVYSDVIAGGVWACAPDGSVRELLAKRRGVGGIVPHADGGWVISGRTLLHVQPGGAQREILAEDGVCGFNDLATMPDGDLLAGALRYRPLAGEAPRAGALMRISPGGDADVLSEEVLWPNGIGVSPDGETIYLSDYASATVLALDIGSGRVLEFGRSPAGSADGLALDAEGGVWLALGEGGAIARFQPDGSLDDLIEVPASFVSSLCFGGPDMRDVLITTADNQTRPQTGGTLLRARSSLPGLELTPTAV
jgi:sugar lactone lactonase YvrE